MLKRHCLHFQQWKGVWYPDWSASTQTHTLQTAIHCEVCCGTFLSEIDDKRLMLVLTSISATVAHLLDRTAQCRPPKKGQGSWPQHKHLYILKIFSETDCWKKFIICSTQSLPAECQAADNAATKQNLSPAWLTGSPANYTWSLPLRIDDVLGIHIMT